jgi:hypothetical protein
MIRRQRRRPTDLYTDLLHQYKQTFDSTHLRLITIIILIIIIINKTLKIITIIKFISKTIFRFKIKIKKLENSKG